MKPYIFLFLAITATGLASIAQRPANAESGRETRPAATLSSITQNLKKFEGFYNFYYDDKTGKLYLEIDSFGRGFLYFTSLPEGIGNGGAERGQAEAVVAKFIRIGPKVFLLQPDMEHRAVLGNPDEQKDVADAFSQSILFGFSPVAIEGDKVLIDLTPFVIRDALHLGENIGSGHGNPGSAFAAAANRGGASSAGGGYRLDETRSAVFIDNTRDFPKNSGFEALVTFSAAAAGGGAFRGGGGVAPPPPPPRPPESSARCWRWPSRARG
jgi:hypothetical protein